MKCVMLNVTIGLPLSFNIFFVGKTNLNNK